MVVGVICAVLHGGALSTYRFALGEYRYARALYFIWIYGHSRGVQGVYGRIYRSPAFVIGRGGPGFVKVRVRNGERGVHLGNF